jgi:two-component system sensor histidine kinase BarA
VGIRLFDRGIPFSYLLMGIIFLIIIILALAGIWINYENSEHSLRENADRLRIMTESHLENSIRMIDTGLKLYDNSYNDQMRNAFVVAMMEYNRTGGDPSVMDLKGLKERIGGMEIHVIDDRCVIAYASTPADVGLDFAVIYPDFCVYLNNIRNTSGFYPDRVVMNWQTGTLTKYSYMPTPDHQYILELGMRSERFSDERMNLEYSDIVEEVRSFNPYLQEVLLFQKQKRLVYNTSYVPTAEESAMLDYILWENRTSQVVRDTERGRTIFWQVIDLRDPDYAADKSIFAKLT